MANHEFIHLWMLTRIYPFRLRPRTRSLGDVQQMTHTRLAPHTPSSFRAYLFSYLFSLVPIYSEPSVRLSEDKCRVFCGFMPGGEFSPWTGCRQGVGFAASFVHFAAMPPRRLITARSATDGMIVHMAWHLWGERNRRVFDKKYSTILPYSTISIAPYCHTIQSIYTS